MEHNNNNIFWIISILICVVNFILFFVMTSYVIKYNAYKNPFIISFSQLIISDLIMMSKNIITSSYALHYNELLPNNYCIASGFIQYQATLVNMMGMSIINLVLKKTILNPNNKIAVKKIIIFFIISNMLSTLITFIWWYLDFFGNFKDLICFVNTSHMPYISINIVISYTFTILVNILLCIKLYNSIKQSYDKQNIHIFLKKSKEILKRSIIRSLTITIVYYATWTIYYLVSIYIVITWNMDYNIIYDILYSSFVTSGPAGHFIIVILLIKNINKNGKRYFELDKRQTFVRHSNKPNLSIDFNCEQISSPIKIDRRMSLSKIINNQNAIIVDPLVASYTTKNENRITLSENNIITVNIRNSNSVILEQELLPGTAINDTTSDNIQNISEGTSPKSDIINSEYALKKNRNKRGTMVNNEGILFNNKVRLPPLPESKTSISEEFKL